MSRLDVTSRAPLKTFQYFTDKYREIIKERDKSFYKKKDQGSELDNFAFVINQYTGNEYYKLNQFLRENIVEGFSEKDLKSWAYCLHSSLQFRTSNVPNGTVVYRGLYNLNTNALKVGFRFYLGEFVSTSKNLNVAKGFSDGTILVITLKNNGVNGRNNYCRYVDDISQYKGEEEVLITAFCIFVVKKIEGSTYYLDCEGY